MEPTERDATSSSGGLLDLIERIGNKLPDPATLFLLGTVLIMVVSAVVTSAGVEVRQKKPVPIVQDDGTQIVEWQETGVILHSESLLTREGIHWAIESLVDNFMGFAPLGIVLVGMLGIGIAERTGLIQALLKAFMLIVPARLLTPAMVFVGIMSSMTLDAGYVVLPPLAAALYRAVGRPPLAGLAAVFAGVAAGFNANLFVTGLDPMLAQMSTDGAQVIDPDYVVAATSNWGFMAASTFVITLTGWFVTTFFVERRLMAKPVDEGGPVTPTSDDLEAQQLTSEEKRGMTAAFGAFAAVFALVLAMIFVPGAPLYDYSMPDPSPTATEGATILAEIWTPATDDAQPPANAHVDGDLTLIPGPPFPRWVDTIVPLLFFIFIVPALTYGVVVRKIRNDKDVAVMFIESMKAMAPIIVLAFFAAQFIEHFSYSGLDRMLALAGGQFLGQANMPIALLLILFIALTIVFNLFVGSMSAKYLMFAPIFVPMFMMAGISPELTQAAYRIGDSVSNIVTPLNAYLVIILVFMRQFVPKAGMGTLISTMLPYTVVFSIVWTIMLLVWVQLGIPLGPGGPVEYVPNVEPVVTAALTTASP